MKNFKKVLALTLAVVMILSTMTVSFAATNNDAKAKVLFDLGLFKGVSTTEYAPALEDASDAAQALVLIGRALQWEVDEAATTTFTDVPAWAVPYVAFAVEAKITNGVSDTEFGVGIISGQRVVTWFLRALGYDMADSWNNTATLAATAGIAIPGGTIRDDIVGVIYDALMSTPVGGTSTLIEMIVLGDAAKTAVAEKAGLIDATLSIVSVMAVGVDSVEVTLNKAVVTADTTVEVKKGAANYASDVEWNDALNTATVSTVVELPDAEYTAIVTVGDVVLSKTFVVAEEAESAIKITSKVLDDETEDYEVKFVVENQYGEDMDVNATEVSVVAYNVTQTEVVTVVKPADNFFTVDTNKDKTGTVDEDAFEVGDIVRFTVTYKGMTTQSNLTVMDPAASDTIVLGDVILADKDDTKLDETDADPQLVYTLLDQYGEEIFLSTAADEAAILTNDNVTFVISDTGVIASVYVEENDDDEGELFLEVVGDGTAVITAVVNASGAVATATIVVAKESEVDAVAIAGPAMLVAAGDDEFELALTITDQYGDIVTDVAGIDSWEITIDGDVMTPVSTYLSASDADDETILTVDLSGAAVISKVDETMEVVITALDADDDELGSVKFDVEPEAEANKVKASSFATVFEFDGTTGAVLTIDNGDLTVLDQYGRDFEGTITLTTDDATVVATTGSTMTAIAVGTATITVDVDGKELDVDVEVIDSEDIQSYAMTEVGLVYAPGTGDYLVDVEIDGVDADGNAVALIDVTPDYVTSSKASVATVSGNTITGVEEGTTVISVWMDGVKVDSETVTVSEEDPYAVSVEWDETTIATGANLNTIIIVKDQYGVDITLSTTLFYSESDDDFSIASGVITGAGKGDVTVITPNGLSAKATITVN